MNSSFNVRLWAADSNQTVNQRKIISTRHRAIVIYRVRGLLPIFFPTYCNVVGRHTGRDWGFWRKVKKILSSPQNRPVHEKLKTKPIFYPITRTKGEKALSQDHKLTALMEWLAARSIPCTLNSLQVYNMDNIYYIQVIYCRQTQGIRP